MLAQRNGTSKRRVVQTSFYAIKSEAFWSRKFKNRPSEVIHIYIHELKIAPSGAPVYLSFGPVGWLAIDFTLSTPCISHQFVYNKHENLSPDLFLDAFPLPCFNFAKKLNFRKQDKVTAY